MLYKNRSERKYANRIERIQNTKFMMWPTCEVALCPLRYISIFLSIFRLSYYSVLKKLQKQNSVIKFKWNITTNNSEKGIVATRIQQWTSLNWTCWKIVFIKKTSMYTVLSQHRRRWHNNGISFEYTYPHHDTSEVQCFSDLLLYIFRLLSDVRATNFLSMEKFRFC